jgi:hypothetical protein
MIAKRREKRDAIKLAVRQSGLDQRGRKNLRERLLRTFRKLGSALRSALGRLQKGLAKVSLRRH